MQITNYQCPACTGPLHFAGESGKLECDYCGSSFDVAEIEALYAEKEEKAAQAMEQAESAAQAPPEAAGDGSQWDTSVRCPGPAGGCRGRLPVGHLGSQ